MTTITEHLARFPADRGFVTSLLAVSQSFDPENSCNASWFRFNLLGIERTEVFIETLERMVGSLEGMRVLDVGAGAGGATIAFARHGCEVVGVEPDDIRFSWLQERKEAHGFDFEAIHAPIETAEIEGKFDLVHCNAVLEHVPAWEPVVSRLLELSRGRIYLSWPNKLSPLEIASDSHFGLVGGTFTTGRLHFLQPYYLKVTGWKRPASVYHAPTLCTVKRFMARDGCKRRVTHFIPASWQKLDSPDQINNSKARKLIRVFQALGVSNRFIRRLLINMRKAHEILITDEKPGETPAFGVFGPAVRLHGGLRPPAQERR